MTTTTRPRYRVVLQRSGVWWAVSSPDLDGFFSQVRNRHRAEEIAREGIALLLDVDPASFEIVLT